VGSIAGEGFSELKVINTLCREAQKRQACAVQLCKKVDVMFVLGGLDSANTRKLAELCKKYNSQTYHLQNWKKFDKRVVLGKKVAGVTAGASTPKWVIDEFVANLEMIRPPPLLSSACLCVSRRKSRQQDRKTRGAHNKKRSSKNNGCKG
jgi:4-hydroxy-3-methylbut-2-enyl diphosphate reductase IspH